MSTKKVEKIVILIFAVLGAIAALLDLFLDLPIITERISQIILFVVSLLLGYFIYFQYPKLDKIEEKLSNIENKLTQKDINEFNNYENLIDPVFKKIFKDKISESFHFIRDLIKSKSITINDLSQFRFFYKSIIQENPKRSFFVTSIPSPNYVWEMSEELNPLEQAMKKHIEEGGRFTRIIFVEKDEIGTTNVTNFIKKQLKMGVILYYVQIDEVDKRLQKNFFFMEDENLVCEGFLNRRGELSEAKMEISKSKKEIFEGIFNELLNNTSIKKCSI